MMRALASVGALTLLSRATGFLRDMALGALLGAGAAADAFFVALRIPNHFRAIFGEGAFNAAFLPGYARALEAEGAGAARLFAGRVLTLLLVSQIILLVLAMIFMRPLIGLLAPGWEAFPEKFDLAVTLTRVTFPYLLCVTLVTLFSATLNAHRRFAAAAFAPVLLNLAMLAALAVAFLFPSAAHAAAAGVLLAGALELALIVVAARRAGVLARPAAARWTPDVARFFRTLGPAVIGAGGVQLAILADTIIVALLPTGAPSSLYYADRIYQLPIGVIAVAAGTVLLPEMSRRLAAGDEAGAAAAQNRTMALTLALAAPFFVAFLTIPDVIMRAVFLRGRFGEADALAAAQVLLAYGNGLLAVVLIRSAVASFQARGDTRTPMLVSLFAVAANVALKLALYKSLGAAGLAAATAAGAWINLLLLMILAARSGALRLDARVAKVAGATALASLALAGLAILGAGPARAAAAALTRFVNEAQMLLLAAAGMVVYAAVFFATMRALRARL